MNRPTPPSPHPDLDKMQISLWKDKTDINIYSSKYQIMCRITGEKAVTIILDFLDFLD